MSRFRAVLPAALLLLLTLAMPAVATALPAPVPVPPEVQEQLGRLGVARVIVSLAPPPSLPGAASPASAAARQRVLAGLQDAVLADLATAGARVQGVSRFAVVPGLALVTDGVGLARLAASPLVMAIQPNRLSRPLDLQSNQIMNVSPATGAWAMGYDGEGWIVAVLDTGVQTLPTVHPFLAPALGAATASGTAEWCFSAAGDPTPGPGQSSLCPSGLPAESGPGASNDCPLSVDGCGHGTHVAGIAVGRDAAGTPGYAGTARRAGLISMQVFTRFENATADGCGVGRPAPCVRSYDSDQILALEQVLAQHNLGRKIAAVNMSLGGGKFTSTQACDAANGPMKIAVDNLRAVGIATIIAAGNASFNDGLGSPACISSAVSIASSTKPGPGQPEQISEFSNFADFVSLVATGSSINSSYPEDAYKNLSGISMAAPGAAGIWAILRQARGSAPGNEALVAEILKALQDTGAPLNRREPETPGDPPVTLSSYRPRVDAGRALAALLGTQRYLPQVFRGNAAGW